MMLSKVCITRHFVRTGCCIKEILLVAYYDSELLNGVRSKCETNKIMALSGIECPQMHWDGDNIKENWRRFKQHVELMFNGRLQSRREAEKCSYLLIWVGKKSLDIYNTWTDITADNKNNLQTYYDRFEAHVSPAWMLPSHKTVNLSLSPVKPGRIQSQDMQISKGNCLRLSTAARNSTPIYTAEVLPFTLTTSPLKAFTWNTWQPLPRVCSGCY